MRRRRLKAPGYLAVAYYHCVSRVVNRDFVLGEEEKERLVELMRCYERLLGLRVVAYCMMSNHFHILVEVPRRPADEELPDDAALVARVRETLGDGAANELEWELALHRGRGDEVSAEELRQRWFGRMWDVSAFMKVLKQRFSQWFNGRHGRRGTLWEDRFRSVLVEGAGDALRAMAAYIDLNPVRAGICEDPKDYRWCGYGEAVAGGWVAREAVRWLAELDPHGGHGRRMAPGAAGAAGAAEGVGRPEPGGMQPQEVLRRWRCHLFGVPAGEAEQVEVLARVAGGGAASAARAEPGTGGGDWTFRRRISRAKALEVLAAGGNLSRADYLRCRVRYFTDGAVIGGRAFVEAMFLAFRDRFGPQRRDGPRLLRGLAPEGSDEGLFNLRQLRTRVFG